MTKKSELRAEIQKISETYMHRPVDFISDVIEIILSPKYGPNPDIMVLNSDDRLKALKDSNLHETIRLALKVLFYLISLFSIIGIIGQYALEFL